MYTAICMSLERKYWVIACELQYLNVSDHGDIISFLQYMFFWNNCFTGERWGVLSTDL